MIKFPSVGSFRNATREVRLRATFVGKDRLGSPIYDNSRMPPTLKYVGTIKVRGIKSSIIQPKGESALTVLSGNREVSIDDDNFGFAQFVLEEVSDEYWSNFFSAIRSHCLVDDDAAVTIYGDWMEGESRGEVATGKLDRMFIVSAIRFGEDAAAKWLSPQKMESMPVLEHKRVKNAFDFPHYELEIDFANPKSSQDTLNSLTSKVKEFPGANALGMSEVVDGIVWRCASDNYLDPRFWFKVKVRKESLFRKKESSHVDPEVKRAITRALLTEQRLVRGIEFLRSVNEEILEGSTGVFLRWIVKDVFQEEFEAIEGSGLTDKKVRKIISSEARKWFLTFVRNEDSFRQ